MGRCRHLANVVWTLHSCAPIPGATVLSFEDEGEMLMSFRSFVEASDPDFLSGYNIINFDLPSAKRTRPFLEEDRTSTILSIEEIESWLQYVVYGARYLAFLRLLAIRIHIDVLTFRAALAAGTSWTARSTWARASSRASGVWRTRARRSAQRRTARKGVCG